MPAVPNKALAELQSLLDGQQQALTAAAQTRNFVESRSGFDLPDKDKAGFATPEALVTAVGAGWILGPVGGVLMGVAQGILGKRAKQTALDAFDKQNQVRQNNRDIFRERLDELALDADPDEQRVLDGLWTTYQMGLNKAATVGMEQEGMKQMAEAVTGMDAYADDKLRRKIEDEALMNAETYDLFKTLHGNFRADMSGFEDRHVAAINVMNGLADGNGAEAVASLAAMPLIINPEAGATTDAEVALWTGVTGSWDQFLSRLEKELTPEHGGLSDESRRQIKAVAERFMKTNLMKAQATEARYGRLLVSQGIPAERWPLFNRSSHLPNIPFKGFVPRDTPPEGRNKAAAEILGIAFPAGEALVDTLGGLYNAMEPDEDTVERAKERLRNTPTGIGGNK